jgi:hypothetical protein
LWALFLATHFLYFQKLALQYVFKKEGQKGQWLRGEKAARFFTISHARQMLPQDSQSPLPWEQMGSGVEAMDQIVAQQLRRESPKNKGWQQQGRTTTTVPFLKQSSGNKKA